MTLFQLRAYQKKILAEVSDCNGVVLLPTGAGKTAIAAELMRLKVSCGGPKRALFLVPTVLLVKQQAQAIRDWSGLETAEYSGGMSLPEGAAFRILVSTPMAFQMAQAKREDLLGWACFSVVVFDEVHHELKDHPYRKLALSLGRHCDRHESMMGTGRGGGAPQSGIPQVLGLTASLSYAVTEKKIQDSIGRLMRELRMDRIATATRAELIASGYHATAAAPERRVASQSESGGETADTAVIDLSAAAIDPSSLSAADPKDSFHPVEQRKPHLLLPTFWSRVQNGKATMFARDLLHVIRARETALTPLMPCGFVSPLGLPPPPGGDYPGAGAKKKLSDWGEYAHKAAGHCKRGDAAREHLLELEQWYEALRIVVASWEENRELALLFLDMMLPEKCLPGDAAHTCPRAVCPEAHPAVDSAEGFFRKYPTVDAHVRLNHLKEVLLEKHDDDFRGIVFVQQRVTTHILVHFLERDEEIRSKIHSSPLYAVTSPATPSLAVPKGLAAETLKKFAAGEINLLVATVVAEEGMDIPAANCVIRFDPVLNAVSHVQGRGRARQADSSFVVLAERGDRPTPHLQAVEQQQLAVAQSFRPEAQMGEEERRQHLAKLAAAQRSRETTAAALLTQGPLGTPEAAWNSLHLYAKKTKVELVESYTSLGSMEASGGQRCELRYESCLRLLVGSGTCAAAAGMNVAKQKKQARAAAASDLLARLAANEGYAGA